MPKQKADEGRSGGRRPLPAVLPPGLPSTVDVLARRARKGQSLFDPVDVTLPATAGIVAVRAKNSTTIRAGLALECGAVPAAGFGGRLRQIRTGRKIGLRQLAARAGLSPAVLSKLETGRQQDFSLDTAIALADALRLPLDTLLGRTVPVAG